VNVEFFANAIRRFLEDPDLRNRFAAACRDSKIERSFDIQMESRTG